MISSSRWLLLAFLVLAAASLRLDHIHEGERTFCWKSSYLRGLGSQPTECKSGIKVGQLCFEECDSGYSRLGFDCMQQCLPGWRDDVFFCTKPEYDRGTGYGWQLGDDFNSKGMFSRCQKDHGEGNCEQNGAVVSPKCKSGYESFGCCTCRPPTPDCVKLGYTGGIGLSCYKNITMKPSRPLECANHLQNNLGVCYQKCKDNYSGVGPLCWGKPPQGWVSCGLGAAKTQKDCSSVVKDQIQSVREMAYGIIIFLQSGGISSIVKGVKNLGNIPELKNKFASFKKIFLDAAKIKQLFEKAKNTKFTIENSTQFIVNVKVLYQKVTSFIGIVQEMTASTLDTITVADVIRISAQIVGLLEPTGIAGVVQNFSQPTCSQL